MKNKTTEFSFVLKPSEHGVGVFCTHDIKKDTYLRLFGDEKEIKHNHLIRNKGDIPKFFEQYCIDRDDKLISPKDFGQMAVGWYLNHSKNSNAYHKNYHYYALRDIKEGEEIIIDYNYLEEPEKFKEDYYR